MRRTGGRRFLVSLDCGSCQRSVIVATLFLPCRRSAFMVSREQILSHEGVPLRRRVAAVYMLLAAHVSSCSFRARL